MEKSGKGILSAGENVFILQQGSQKFDVWSGFAFENVIFQHVEELKKTLGLSDIRLQAYTWETSRRIAHGSLDSIDKKGAQVDLVLDRDDGVINLCEIKFYDRKFSIDKSYAENLKNKVSRFREITRTDKTIMLVMISACHLVENEYAKQILSRSVSANDIMRT